MLLRGRKAIRLTQDSSGPGGCPVLSDRTFLQDHKPERPDETARIQQAGGIVISTPCGTHRVGKKNGQWLHAALVSACFVVYNNVTRFTSCCVCCVRFLSTSRSFGDLELKERPGRGCRARTQNLHTSSEARKFATKGFFPPYQGKATPSAKPLARSTGATASCHR